MSQNLENGGFYLQIIVLRDYIGLQTKFQLHSLKNEGDRIMSVSWAYASGHHENMGLVSGLY